jgi:hypothetical protein
MGGRPIDPASAARLYNSPKNRGLWGGGLGGAIPDGYHKPLTDKATRFVNDFLISM